VPDKRLGPAVVMRTADGIRECRSLADRHGATNHNHPLSREPHVPNARMDERHRLPTPQATIEAVVYCVRERGLAALREAANQQRLMTFDDAARAEVNRRIAKLEEGRSNKVSQNVS
jgi:hypothetical protein